MNIQVFGHKSPDTDSTGSPLIWAWYLNEIKGTPATPVLLGEPNTEAAFMLDRWNLTKPEIISDVDADAPVVIVDTNNPAELPDGINGADIQAIIDHHKLVGGLETKGPIDITVRPLACTATIMHDLIGDDMGKMPEQVKGAMLTCILSDTLEFRSPTTTDHDKAVAEKLAADLGVGITDLANEMFAAKSDVSSFSEAELLRMDSKEYEVGGKQFRVSEGDRIAVAGELMGVQNACMHGNTYACNQLNMAAMQLNAQVQAMNAPAGIPGGQMMTHDQRMAYQRQQFAAHQARMAQRSAAMDRSHQSFLEYLRQ